MAATWQKRQWWSRYLCNSSAMVKMAFPGQNGEVWYLSVAKESVAAWRQFIKVMKLYGYEFRESAGGTYNCRRIGGSSRWSLHAYGIALDLNPSVNRYGQPHNDFPPGFVQSVLAIEFNGKRAFRWGGNWDTPDPMHFEIDIPPRDIPEVEIPVEDDEDMQEIVKGIQTELKEAGFDPGPIDGIWGPKTQGGFGQMAQAAAKKSTARYTDQEAVAAVKRAL